MMTLLLGWSALSVLGAAVAVGLIRAGKRREAQAYALARMEIVRTPFQVRQAR